jgi:serine/threonine protein kinase
MPEWCYHPYSRRHGEYGGTPVSTVLPFDFGSSYQAIRKIGQGASGRVFEGVDRVHGDHVAIKILRSDLDDDAQLVQRFVNERRTLTELDHPRIIAVRDLIVDQGMLGIVMELATGPTLGAQLAASGPMAPAAALAVVRQVAEALSYAHGRGVVHRDIKPDNIILTNLDGADDPEVKVADFGIAKILGESSTATHLVGTAHYLAPELIRDNVLSPSVDVYALGVTLYQMVSGQLPFGAGDDNPYAVAERHLHSTPAVIPGLDDQVWGLISGMLAKNPADRLSDDDVASLAGNIIVDVEGQLPLSVPEGTLVPHAMTMLRQPTSLTAHQGDEESVAVTGDRPAPINLENLRTLSRPASATILKAGPELDGETLDDSSVGEDAKESWWSSRTHRIVVGAAGILIIVAVVLWIVVGGGFRGANKQGSKVVDGLSASLPMQTYPSGLSVTRAATVNKGTLKYSLTYRTISSR